MDARLAMLMPKAPEGMRFHVYAYEPYGQKSQWLKVVLEQRGKDTFLGKERWVTIGSDQVIPTKNTAKLYGSIEQKAADTARDLITSWELGKGLARFDGYYG